MHIHFHYSDDIDSSLAKKGWLDDGALFKKNIEFATKSLLQRVTTKENLYLSINIISDKSIKRTAGGSFYLGRCVGKKDGIDIYEPSALTKINNYESAGFKKYGYDMFIKINPDIIEKELWFNPKPTEFYQVPADKKDFISMIIHELFHCLGIAGYFNVNGTDRGILNSKIMTIFDSKIAFEDKKPYFVFQDGDKLSLFWSDDIFLSYSNIYHIDSIVCDSIINPEVPKGVKKEIKEIDIKILKELGYMF